MAAVDPNRLYSMLLNTGLQTKDNALYQVIYNLIGSLAQTNKVVNNISTGSTTIINQNILQLPFDDPIEGPQGPIGITGSQGIQGPQGIQGIQGVIGLDGNDGEDSLIPGPIGLTGATGPAGSSSSGGATVFLPDLENIIDNEYPRIGNNTRIVPYITAYSTSNQSVNDSTQTAVQFNTNEFGDSSMHDPVGTPTIFKAPASGIYFACCSLVFDHNSGGSRIIKCTVNGLADTNGGGYGIEPGGSPGAPTDYFGSIVFSLLLSMTKGDYIEFYVFQTSGGALNILAGAAGTHYNPRASLFLITPTASVQ